MSYQSWMTSDHLFFTSHMMSFGQAFIFPIQGVMPLCRDGAKSVHFLPQQPTTGTAEPSEPEIHTYRAIDSSDGVSATMSLVLALRCTGALFVFVKVSHFVLLPGIGIQTPQLGRECRTETDGYNF